MDTETAKLLVTDFDGTLVGIAGDSLSQGRFAHIIKFYQHSGGIWVVATGRSLGGFKRYFYPLEQYGIKPDYLICRNAYIYRAEGKGYRAKWGWNIKIRSLIKQEQKRRNAFLSRLKIQLSAAYKEMKLSIVPPDILNLRFRSHKNAIDAAQLTRDVIRGAKSLMVFEYYQEVEIRTVPFTKGMSINRLARHLSIQKEDILTIGDGHNDISMLASTISGMAACPANASAEVMDVIHQRSGHISRFNSIDGVLDAINAYSSDGVVCSELPEGAVLSQARSRKSFSGRSSTGQDRAIRKWRKVRRIGILLVISYVVLLVVAYFGLIPYGQTISAPLHFFVDMLSMASG